MTDHHRPVFPESRSKPNQACPPPLPNALQGLSADKRQSNTRKLIPFIILVLTISTVACLWDGSLLLLPLHVAPTALFLGWLIRFKRALTTGIITSRIRTEPRTTSLVRFSFTHYDEYNRGTRPFQFWMTFLIEIGLFIFISPFLVVLIIAPFLTD